MPVVHVLAFDDFKETPRSVEWLAFAIASMMVGILVIAWIGETFDMDWLRWVILAWAVGWLALARVLYNARRFRRRVSYRLTLSSAALEIDRTPIDAPPTVTRIPWGIPGLRVAIHRLNEGGSTTSFARIVLPDGQLALDALDRPVQDQVSGITRTLSAWLEEWSQGR